MSVTDKAHRSPDSPREAPRDRPLRPAVAWALAAVAILVAGSAVMGGVMLIRTGFAMPIDWLVRTPFSTWLWPGVLLIATVAVPQLLAAVAALVVTRWSPPIGWLAGYLAGAGLVIWIAAQLAILQRYFYLQPVIAGLGLLEIALAALWQFGDRRGRQQTAH